MTTIREGQLLAGLMVVFVGLVVWRQITAVPPLEVPLKFKSGQSAASRTNTTEDEEFELPPPRASGDESPTAPRKNIFASLDEPLLREAKARRNSAPRTSVAVPVTPPPPIQPAVSVAPAERAPPAPSPEELAAQAERERHALKVKQVREQMAQFRYLGYLNQNGERKGFVGKGHEIYIVRQGDTLDGRFLVALMDATTVTLRDASENLETTLQLKTDASPESS